MREPRLYSDGSNETAVLSRLVRRTLGVGQVALLLAACSPMQFQNISSPNTFQQDKYDCELLLGYRGGAYAPQPTDQLADFLVRGRDEMQACLERKGWK